MITFQTRLTKKGRTRKSEVVSQSAARRSANKETTVIFKVPLDILNIMSACPGDDVIVSVDLDCDCLMVSRYDDNEDGINVPADLLDEAGIDTDNYQMYADNGRVVIIEGDEYDE